MKTRIGILPGAIVETVTRYVGHEVSLTDDFSDDVGLDSIDRLNLMTAVEQAHDVELSDEEIASANTLGELLKLLKVEAGESDVEAGKSGPKSVRPQA
jgi:acyl carrier protein